MASGRMIFCNASHSRAARVPTHGGAPRATGTKTPRRSRAGGVSSDSDPQTDS